jgi:hypothetical protein
VSFSPEATNSYTILDDAVVEAFIPSHFFPSKRGASREYLKKSIIIIISNYHIFFKVSIAAARRCEVVYVIINQNIVLGK